MDKNETANRKVKNYAEIWLAYFKQGDDLASHLEDNAPADAFREHATRMKAVSEHLDAIADEVMMYNQEDIKVEADTHHIGISGPEALITTLLEKELADYPDYIEEIYEEEECDCEECTCKEHACNE